MNSSNTNIDKVVFFYIILFKETNININKNNQSIES